MNWTEFIDAAAERSGVSRKDTRAALSAAAEVITEALGAGNSVSFRNLGSFDTTWHAPRVMRGVQAARRMLLDGRYSTRFRPGAALKRAVLARTPQTWKQPEHQAAWRLAETLLGDLELYHAERLPKDLTPQSTDEEVRAACQGALGSVWIQVCRTYDSDVPADVRNSRDYIALVARRRWAADD